MQFLRNLIADENGASAIEYGMIAVVMALVLAAAMPDIGDGVETRMQSVSDKM